MMNIEEKNTMVVAFPTSDKATIDGHFGHTKEFALFTIKDNEILNVKYVTPPKHEPGVLPRFLGEQGINVIVTGGMGQMAVDLFNNQGINVILGAAGSIEVNLNDYIGGMLTTKGSSCKHEHGESHEC